MKKDTCPACGRGKPGPKVAPKRDARIISLHKRGQSVSAIASVYGLTDARIYQIIAAAQA